MHFEPVHWLFFAKGFDVEVNEYRDDPQLSISLTSRKIKC